MNRNTNRTTDARSQRPKGKAPSHIAYHVREGENGGFWTRIGAAWEHQDGKGLNIQVQVVPLDGRITLRVPNEEPQE